MKKDELCNCGDRPYHYPDIRCTGLRLDEGLRTFPTGATRDTDVNKPDYEACMNPLVDESYGKFIMSHRKQPDGSMRSDDNWQKGIPKEVYLKSLMRHVLHLRLIHRGYEARDEKGDVVNLEDTLNAIRFNTQGYLLETLKESTDVED